MLKLLTTEWLKIKTYKAFLVLGSFFILGVFTSNYIVYSTTKSIVTEAKGAGAGMLGKFNPYDFNSTWQTTSYTTGFLLLLPALLLIILVTNEFTFRTNRQNILDGWSRYDFISVKLMLALIVAVISTVLVIATALGFGFTSGTDFSTNGISHVGYFFFKALTYNLISVLISVWIRKTGFAIGLYFIYLGAENIVSQLLDLWSIRLRSRNIADLGSMGDYLPMNAADGLLTFPENPLKSIARGTLPTDYTWVVMTLVGFYIVLFVWLSIRRMLRSDL